MLTQVTRRARAIDDGAGVVVDFGLVDVWANMDAGQDLRAVVSLEYSTKRRVGQYALPSIVGRAINSMNPSATLAVSLAYQEASLLAAALSERVTTVHEVLAAYGEQEQEGAHEDGTETEHA
jgi:phosphoribosylcarboxyaminoimidazole (NCAIR) mutase